MNSKILFFLGFVALVQSAQVVKNTVTAKKPWMPPGPALGVEILVPEESLEPAASTIPVAPKVCKTPLWTGWTPPAYAAPYFAAPSFAYAAPVYSPYPYIASYMSRTAYTGRTCL